MQVSSAFISVLYYYSSFGKVLVLIQMLHTVCKYDNDLLYNYIHNAYIELKAVTSFPKMAK